jgi:hypothetical protein
MSRERILGMLGDERLAEHLTSPKRCPECGTLLSPEPVPGRTPKYVCLNCPVDPTIL